MISLGHYPFSEEGRLKILKLTGLINEQEKFSEDVFNIVALNTFSLVIKRVDPAVLEELKKSIKEPGLFQSTFRTRVAEQTVEEVFKTQFNSYIDQFLKECGGNYSDTINEEIESLKFQMAMSSGLSLAAK